MERAPQRIVSLSPNVTEMLFAIGAGERLVGVTRYCNFPPQAKKLPKVGGLLDPNFEALVALDPDLVIVAQTADDLSERLQQLGLQTLELPHRTVDDVLASIERLGERLGRVPAAEKLVNGLRRGMAELQRRTAGLRRPGVLLAIERTLGSGRIQDVYTARPGGFLDRIISLAGGRNVCPNTAAPFPILSAEAIIEIDPEVIIDMVPMSLQRQYEPEQLLKDWQSLPELKAVQAGRVYLLTEQYAFIPGPRFLKLARRLAELIHPELHWPAEPKEQATTNACVRGSRPARVSD